MSGYVEFVKTEMVMKRSKMFWALGMSLALAGCGGGDSGGSGESGDSSSGDTSVSGPDRLEARMSMNEEQVLKARIEAGAELHVDGVGVSVSRLGEGVIRIRVAEVDRPRTVTIETRDKEGGTLKSTRLEIINTSAADLVARADDAVRNEAGLKSLEEDRRYFVYVTDLLYLNGDISATGKGELISQYDDSDHGWRGSLDSRIGDLESTLEQYRNGKTSDTVLELDYNRVASAMEAAGDANLANLDLLPPSADAFLPDLRATTLEYRAQAGGFSRFYGDPDFGAASDSGFVFNQQHEWLREIAQGEGGQLCTSTAGSL